jgi:hypothetical protein
MYDRWCEYARADATVFFLGRHLQTVSRCSAAWPWLPASLTGVLITNSVCALSFSSSGEGLPSLCGMLCIGSRFS